MSGQSDTGTSGIAKFFEFDKYDTDLSTELIAGATTFLTMSYIIVVNPAILGAAIDIPGYSDAQVFQMIAIATIISAVIGGLVMALYAKRPFGVAPGMGLNAFFAFTVVIAMGISWQTALAAVFVEGIIFILLTAIGARKYIISIFPEPVKFSVGAGIGAFLLFIGLQEMEIIVGYEATLVTLGNVAQNPWAILGLLGLLLTLMLFARGIKGSIIIGILTTAAVGWLLTLAGMFERGVVTPAELPSPHYDVTPLVGAFIEGLADIEPLTFTLVVFTFFFVDFFDTAGVLLGVGQQADLLDEEGDLPEMEKPLMADAIATTVGAMVGTSTATTYIESATGIEEGGRTGLTALVIAALFAVALIAVPVIAAIPDYAIYLALVIVGLIMLEGVTDIEWDDPAWAITAGLTILIMPLTFSIAWGIAAGLMVYPAVKFAQGKGTEVHLGQWLLALAFVFYLWTQTSGLIG